MKSGFFLFALLLVIGVNLTFAAPPSANRRECLSSLSEKNFNEKFLELEFKPRFRSADSVCRESMVRDYIEVAIEVLQSCGEDSPSAMCEKLQYLNVRTLEFLSQTTGVHSMSEVCNSYDFGFKGLFALSDILKLNQRCQELEVGTSEVNDNSSSQTTVPQSYRLSRTSKDEYKVDVSIQFSFEPTPPDRRSQARADRAIQNAVNGCLEKANKYFLGPNGRRIKIEVNGPGARLAPTNEVLIGGSGRTNSGNWTFGADCATVVHETLHLLGLADGYQEQQIGYVTDPQTGVRKWVEEGAQTKAFDCRHLEKENSIMHNEHARWTDVFGEKEMETCVCWDKSGMSVGAAKSISYKMDECNRQLDSFAAKKIACPGTSYKMSTVPNTEAVILPQVDSSGQIYTGMGGGTSAAQIESLPKSAIVEGTDIAPSETSLLEPEQFNAILFPNCLSRNEKYFKCGQDSYRTSADSPCLIPKGAGSICGD